MRVAAAGCSDGRTDRRARKGMRSKLLGTRRAAGLAAGHAAGFAQDTVFTWRPCPFVLFLCWLDPKARNAAGGERGCCTVKPCEGPNCWRERARAGALRGTAITRQMEGGRPERFARRPDGVLWTKALLRRNARRSPLKRTHLGTPRHADSELECGVRGESRSRELSLRLACRGLPAPIMAAACHVAQDVQGPRRTRRTRRGVVEKRRA